MPSVFKVEEKPSTTQASTNAASLRNIGVNQTVAQTFPEDSTVTFKGGLETLQFSSLSNPASFSRHIMCKADESYWDGTKVRIKPVDPTTIFRPSDTKAECLTTVTISNKIEFRWFYRSDSSKTWFSCFNWSRTVFTPGEYDFVGFLNIAEYWPAYNYPRAYKVDVYLDNSPSPAFSEFFEVTNAGLNSSRVCEDVVNGNPVNVKSRFTIGKDAKVHHYLSFDKIAYYNEELGCCHNFTTVWIQPNGTTYKTYSGNYTDYKDTEVTWNYWENKTILDDYITIDSSTPVGNWKIEVYLDRYFNNKWMQYGPVATTPFIVGSETVADWTFMVYLDADNNLEEPGIDVFRLIASVGSTSQVNIVVQMDRIAGYDSRYGNWTDCNRFNVTKNMIPTPGNATQNLGEVNMGDPNTLKDFVNWATNNYPANYYSLALWNHGTGFMGLCYDITNATDFLSLPELGQALSALPATMDVVHLDACSMSMTEVAYQIKDYANVLVGPEGLGYAPPPYDDYLSILLINSTISPSEFSKEVVTHYINWCNSEPLIENATMSAIDLTKTMSLMVAINDFAFKLKEKETLYHPLISSARNLTEGYPGPYAGQSGNYIDLYHFAQLIYQNVLDAELRNTANQMMTTLEHITIAEAHKACPSSHGLSIFFPNEKQKYNDFKTQYEMTTFAKDSPWNEFVIYHLDIKTSGCIVTIQTEPPYSDIQIVFDEETYTTDAAGKLRVYVFAGSYIVSVPTLVSADPGSRGIFKRWREDGETSPSRTIIVTGSPTYTADYYTQFEVTFSQSGVGTDFTETVVTIDEIGYNATGLSVSFWWNESSTHSFAFQSPLTVIPSVQRYVWNSTSGLSSKQSDSLTVSTSGSVIGSFKTQFYLALSTNPIGVVTPLGEGWHYNGTDASISTQEFVDIMPVGSRYRFDGWTTADMTKISDPNLPSTTVRIDQAKTVTANYVTEYHLTVISPYEAYSPPSGWYEVRESINVTVVSPVSGPTGTRYVCTEWTGTGSVPTSGATLSVAFMINAPSTITWHWKTQYLLTVNTNPTGLSPQPTVSPEGPWYDNGTLVTCTAQINSGRVFDHWTCEGASWDRGVNSITITMNRPEEATAYYVQETTWWENLSRPEILQIIVGVVGTLLSVAFVGAAWFTTRRRMSVTKAFLNQIDNIYSKLKTDPSKCEEELCRIRNTILEGVTNGKITHENYEIIDKRIDRCLDELKKK
jgi:hypothetical protein